MPIRAVIFDLGDTLLDTQDPIGWAGVAGSVGIAVEPEHLAHAFRELESETDAPDAPPLIEFWQMVLSRASGRAVERSDVERFSELWFLREAKPPLFSDVRYCLEQLSADGRGIGLLSNSRSESHCRAQLQRTGIDAFFRCVVSSGSEGIAKPDPEIFRRAAHRMGILPSEGCYVGNLAWRDARSASAVGLHGVWLNRHGWGFGDDPPEITSLTELPRYLREFDLRSR